MAELFANNFAVQLTNGCAAGDSTIQVSGPAPTALQGGQFRILIDQEYMLVTGGQSGNGWNVTRGAGTGEAPTPTAVAHQQGAWVTHLLTSASLTAIAAPDAVDVEDYIALGQSVTSAWQSAITAAQAGPGYVICQPGKTYVLVNAVLFGRSARCRINLRGATIQASPSFSSASGFQLFGFQRIADYDTFQDCVIENGTLDLNSVSQLSGFTNWNGDSGAHRTNILRCGFGDDMRVINGAISTAGGANCGIGFGTTHWNPAVTVGASPYVFQNVADGGQANVPLLVTVRGGTVSDISTSPNNSTWTSTGVTVGTITVPAGYYVRITYSLAPTVTTMEQTQTVVQDCFVGERYECLGCNNGVLMAGATGSSNGMNAIIDRPRVGPGWHCDQGNGAPTQGNAANGSNIDFGSNAWVRNGKIAPGVGENSSDEGIEIDNSIGTIIEEGVQIIDPQNYGLLVRNFQPTLLPGHEQVRGRVQVKYVNISPAVGGVQIVPPYGVLTGAGVAPARAVRFEGSYPQLAPYSVTPSTGIYTRQNNDGVRERHIVSGGTVTKIEVVSSAYIEAVMNLKPLGYWPLDETTGTVATDLVGLQNGVIGGSITLSQAVLANHLRGAAPTFPTTGAGCFVDLSADPRFQFLGSAPFTAICWAKLSALPATFHQFLGTASVGPAGWWLAVDASGNLVIQRYASGVSLDQTELSTITTGTVYMLAAGYDGTNLYLTINGGLTGGSQASSVSSKLVAAGGSLYINGAASYQVAGNIAHVSLHDRWLGRPALQSLYNIATGPSGSLGITSGAYHVAPGESSRITNSVAPSLAVIPG